MRYVRHNARCGGDADYIEGVDDVIERTIIDYKKKPLWRHVIRLPHQQ